VTTVRRAAPPRQVPGPHAARILRAVGSVARATVGKAWNDRILGLSAEAAFWQLLSLAPLLLAALGALGYMGPVFGTDAQASAQNWLLRTAGEIAAPGVVDTVVEPVVAEVLSRGRPEVVSVGFLVGLWAGSSAMATFVNTVTIAYGQRELRGAVRSRLLALRVYLGFLVVGSVLLPLLVVGPDLLLRVLPASWADAGAVVVRLAFWPVTALLMLAALATLYHVATPVRLHWRRAFPGAAVAVALFLLLSVALRVYVDTMATKLMVFSSLAAPILALLYFYALAFAILLGAEFNAALEQRWPRGTRPSTLERLGRIVDLRDPQTGHSPSPPPPPRGSDS
jgi:membrane protein